MLHIERIDRIGMAVADLEPLVELFEGLFGFEAGPVERDAEGGTQRVRMAIPGASDIDWEVAAPFGEDSYLQSFINGRSALWLADGKATRIEATHQVEFFPAVAGG